MRKVQLVVLGALGAGLIAGAAFGWYRWRDRQLASLVRAAVPPIPDLAAWPPEYAVRVRVATAAVNRLEQPVAALRELAFLYHANSCYREAEQAERGLWAGEPKNGQWTYYLADASEKLGDTDAQRTFLEKTVQLAPYYPPARLSLADLLLKLGLSDEARVHYERFLALVPNEPHGRLGLARIAMERGDRNGAVKELQALIHDFPDFPSAHNLLAEIYAAAGDAARADQERRLSGATGEGRRAEDPWLKRIYSWSFDSFRVELSGGTDRQDVTVTAVLPFYEKAVRLAPDDGLGYDALGCLYLQLNRFADAVAILERGIALAPKTPELYGTLAQTMRQQGNVPKAIEVLQRGILAAPDAPLLHCDLGATLEGAGRREEAAASYRDAVRLDPGFAEAHWDLGVCLIDLGRAAEAGASLGRALNLQPRKADALAALVQKQLDAGKLEQAGCCIHVLIEHSPGTPVRQLVEHGLAAAQRAGDEKLAKDLAQLLTQPLP